MAQNQPTAPFLFPQTHSTVLPDPSNFFSPNLLTTPLPTNSFFQNFALNNGDQPEYVHPYLIKSSKSSISVSYPSRFFTSAFIYQVFIADLTISASRKTNTGSHYDDDDEKHVISAYNDLSVTLDFPNSNLSFFLVRGSPYVTFSVNRKTLIFITTIHAILSFSSNDSLTKYTVKLNNGQTWLIYASSPIKLSHSISDISSDDEFSGIIRIAVLLDSNSEYEETLDRFSSCYPVAGEAFLTNPFSVEYKWEKKGLGDLLMLAHPLHLQLLSKEHLCGVTTVLDDFKYRSIDGDLVGVVGDSWLLKTNPVSLTWHSVKGVKKESYDEIVSALSKDVEGLSSSEIATTSSYNYGKFVARAARLALIAEEIGFLDVIPNVKKFLKEAIEPWLDGTFSGNGFLYDEKWGGIVTKLGSTDSGADFGFGVYNDHHYHLGYFLYGIAVLAKIDPVWGMKYKPQAYSIMSDFMNMKKGSNSNNYTRLRCFDLYKLHSWAGGLTEFADGRNQESTSEAVNAYYSAALMGLAYGDKNLVSIGSTLAALEIHAAKMWWHVNEGNNNLYEEDFTKENKLMGVLWSNKRDSGLWFAPPGWKECRLGIHLIPLLPISEILFSNVSFVKEVVDWTMPALHRVDVGDEWKGFVYALQGIYDRQGALENIRRLQVFDDGNSLSNLLWWIHSRGGESGDGENAICQEKQFWVGDYSD